MPIHPHAGQLPSSHMLTSIPTLVSAYYTEFPSAAVAKERVTFGTSGHRGTSLCRTFNEEHIYAITQAVCDVRKAHGITGPLFLGMDTHALSESAYGSALEVLVGNGVEVRIACSGGFTPTPAISHAIISWNKQYPKNLADGIVITPSHNPPTDGGFKYNPPHGGPAESVVTKCIEARANELLAKDNKDVQLVHLRVARQASCVQEYDFVRTYVDGLAQVIDMDAIAASGLKLGVDPLGGASLEYWEPIAEKYKLNLTVVNKEHDPTFRFVPCDKDGKIRMDCSSPYAMSRLVHMKDEYDLAFGCDPDADRHGIVTPEGLMNPNHFLAVAASYIFSARPAWGKNVGLGKTLVTSAMLDRVAKHQGRSMLEVPVGFKWFVPYFVEGVCGFAGEESAGASLLCKDGSLWSTDKDGLVLCLLAAEIMARTASPAKIYANLTEQHGQAFYQRLDAPANEHTRNCLLSVTTNDVRITSIGGEAIQSILTTAPGNNAPIGGVKVVAENGWFAIRPSGTEDICKVYAESFQSTEHLTALQQDGIALLEALVK